MSVVTDYETLLATKPVTSFPLDNEELEPVQESVETDIDTASFALYTYTPHPHATQNVNSIHAGEQAYTGVNTRLAVWLTKHVGSMWTAYSFGLLAIVGLLAILGVFSPIVAIIVAWLSQTFMQLVLLPIIMVGQNVLGRRAEIQADEAFKTTQNAYHDIEQVMQHLIAQDQELDRHMLALLTITTGLSDINTLVRTNLHQHPLRQRNISVAVPIPIPSVIEPFVAEGD